MTTYFSLHVITIRVNIDSHSSLGLGCVLSLNKKIKMRASLLLLFLTGCLAIKRVPLYRMKTARRTLEVI